MGCLNDSLVLGLALESSSSNSTVNHNYKPKLVHNRPCLKFDDDHQNPCNNLEPSLSLGLSGGGGGDQNVDYKKMMMMMSSTTEASPNSNHSGGYTVSNSFSSGSRVVKRERDVSSEEEIDASNNLSNRVISDEDDEDGSNNNTRKKLRLTKQQSALLEDSFKQHSTLNPKQKQALARQLNLRPRQVEVWFQNRRARTKLKQTEVDCEFLKKCCETLTDENRRLQKEVQELKALKMGQPFYMQMQMPAATLTMCPSCERIGGNINDNNNINPNSSKNNNNNNINPFSIAPINNKPHHFFNPFTNPSAAC